MQPTNTIPANDQTFTEDDLFAEAPTRVIVIDTRELSGTPSVVPHLVSGDWDSMDGRREWYPHDI